MIDKLGWQTLQQRRSTSRLVMFYKIVYQLVAVDMPPCYYHPTRTSARHHSLHYYQISTTKDYYKFSFFPRTVVLWNSLPNSVVTSDVPIIADNRLSLDYCLKFRLSIQDFKNRSSKTNYVRNAKC